MAHVLLRRAGLAVAAPDSKARGASLCPPHAAELGRAAADAASGQPRRGATIIHRHGRKLRRGACPGVTLPKDATTEERPSTC